MPAVFELKKLKARKGQKLGCEAGLTVIKAGLAWNVKLNVRYKGVGKKSTHMCLERDQWLYSV